MHINYNVLLYFFKKSITLNIVCPIKMLDLKQNQLQMGILLFVDSGKTSINFAKYFLTE